MPARNKEFINPQRVFIAILIVVIVWFAPIAFPVRGETTVENAEPPPPLQSLFASSADACPFGCVRCTSWDPDAWPRTCETYECIDGCGGDDGGGGGGGNQPPTISHVLTCSQNGNSGWCVGSLSLDLTASDPQGQTLVISGDVNGTPFTCPTGNTCSIPLPEGAGTANYKVDSATGLSATGTTNYLSDTSTPYLDGSVSGVVGANGWYQSNVMLTITSSDSVSGIASTTTTIDGGVQTDYQSPITLFDGVHSVIITTTDNAGHVTQTTQTFSIDTLTPILNVSLSGTTGLNGWYVSNVTLSATASDSGSGLATLEVSQDGSSYTTYQSPITFSDGIHTYNFRATDNAGNITESGDTLNIDTTTPTLNISTTGVAGLNSWYVSNTDVTPTVNDATSGIASFEVTIDSGPWTAAISGQPITFSDGIHTYTFKVIDNAGNVTESTQTVKVDTITPSLSLNISGTRGQNDWYTSSTTVTPTATDATSGIAALEVSQDGSAYAAYQSTSFSDGVHTYQFRVIDNAGNVTETPIQRLSIDTIAPVVEMDGELKLGEYLYYDIEDPTVAGQENSGLYIYRAVIEDDDENYKKIVWLDVLTGDKARDSILWDGKFADGAQAGWGEYFISLKISDAAGNETMKSATVTVTPLSFLQEIPAFTPPASASTTLPAQTAQTDSTPQTEFGGANSNATGATTSESNSVGGANNGAAGEASASISAGGVTVFSGKSDPVQSGFAQGNESTSSPITNPNILWGAVATAALGATLADWQRRREEEEARRLAAMRNSGGGDEEEAPSKRKSPGRVAYEEKMQQKRIVGESQALLNKKGSAYTPSQKLESEETNWLKKLSPVYQYEKRKEEAQKKADQQAGLMAYYQGRKEGEEKKNTGGPKVLAVPIKADNPPPPKNPFVNWVTSTWNKITTTISSWFRSDSTPTPTSTPTLSPTQVLNMPLPTISIFPTPPAIPVKNPVYAINGAMTVDQIPPEFRCTLPEWKNINGQDLRNVYFDRCILGEQLMTGLLTDPNGWWWQDGQTQWDNKGNIVTTRWEGVKTNEDIWRLALAYGLDTEGTTLRRDNVNGYRPLIEEAIINKFWHFDHGLPALYGKIDSNSGIPDPNDTSPLGTNGRLISFGSLESLEIRITDGLKPPQDGGNTNMWMESWNRYANLFANEPNWIEPPANAPYEIGNKNSTSAYFDMPVGENQGQVLYRSERDSTAEYASLKPETYDIRAIVLNFQQVQYGNSLGLK